MDRYVLERVKEILFSLESYIDESNHGIGLLSGNAGVALFLFYYAKIFNDKRVFDKGMSVLECVLDHVRFDRYASFSAGVPGIAYLLNLLRNSRVADSEIDQEVNDCISAILINKMQTCKIYDYLHGVLGISLYFIDKEEFTAPDAEIVEKVIDYLEQICIIDERSDGLKWQCMFNLNDGIDNYDLSLSHGSAGIILILCKIYKLNIKREKVESLITKSINYILANEFPNKKRSCFFPSGIKNGNIQKSRLAWCYGDLGVAWALWKAGIILDNNNWVMKSVEIFEFSVKRRSFEESSILDAGFCHGLSGVSYMFSRVYNETGEIKFMNTSNYWLKRLLDFDIPNGKAARYKSYHLGKWYDNYSLLEGISGIGLVLLSTLEKEHFWNKIFLLD